MARQRFCVMESTWRDLRFGLRMMAKTPGFTVTSILILAIGIGANTAIFSVVNALLLRPLPLHDPSSLFWISTANPKRGFSGIQFSMDAYKTIRDNGRSFSGVTAYCPESFVLTEYGNPEQLPAARVSANFFDIFGTQPFLGRSFQPAEGEPGGQQVAIISHSLWRRRFGSNPAVVGRPIELNQESYTVIAVMQPAYAFPTPGVDVWVTDLSQYTGLQPEQIQRGAGYLNVIGRLNADVIRTQAQNELDLIFQRYKHDHPANPDADPMALLNLLPLQEMLITSIRPILVLMAGAVGLVLLIACANLTSLLMARSAGRAMEIAIRSALGARRREIIRQLLGESILLSLVGGGLGVLLAKWAVLLVAHLSGNTLPGFRPVALDGGVLLFTLFISLLTGIIFGLTPAIQASRPDINQILRTSGRTNTGGTQKHRIRNLLVTGQIALSVVLLIASGLLIQSFDRLQSVDPGFNPHPVLDMHVDLPLAAYPDDNKRTVFFHEVIRRLQALPGVMSATAGLNMPAATRVIAPVLADGQPRVPIPARLLAQWTAITPDYFKTLGIPLIKGRDFAWADNETSRRVAIINSGMAHRLFPTVDPVGQRFVFGRAEIPVEIVGIVGDVKNRGLDADSGMVFYTSYPQRSWPDMTIAIRVAGDPGRFSRVAEAQVFSVDANEPVTHTEALEDSLASGLTLQRETMWIVAGFGGVALLLALVGLNGIIAYSVEQRTVEIGIRLAIGAQRSDVIQMILGHAMRLTLVGVMVGLVLAALTTRILSKLLFHISTIDLRTYIAMSFAFIIVALAAAFVPTYRATRISPIIALRRAE
jgi:predicted permease